MAVIVWRAPVPLAVMATTFALTLIIPLQYAVLVGVGMVDRAVRGQRVLVPHGGA